MKNEKKQFNERADEISEPSSPKATEYRNKGATVTALGSNPFTPQYKFRCGSLVARKTPLRSELNL